MRELENIRRWLLGLNHSAFDHMGDVERHFIEFDQSNKVIVFRESLEFEIEGELPTNSTDLNEEIVRTSIQAFSKLEDFIKYIDQYAADTYYNDYDHRMIKMLDRVIWISEYRPEPNLSYFDPISFSTFVLKKDVIPPIYAKMIDKEMPYEVYQKLPLGTDSYIYADHWFYGEDGEIEFDISDNS